MAQRPQPSLRLADGGSFLRNWTEKVMRPDATPKRLREIEAPPPAPAPAPPPPPPPNPNATPDNPAGIRFQDGGVFPGPLAGVGEYWSKSNADFEAQNPNLLQRGVRAINPITGFGSAVGAMHDGASSGSMRDMAIAALQAVPVFGAMRTVAPTMKSIAGAAPVLVPSAAKTAAAVATGATAGVAADVAQEQNRKAQPAPQQQNAVSDYAGMNAMQRREKAAGLRFQDGGIVPGSGRGDKIPAKYEPGEFVVSNDMIDDNPGLREQLSGLRAETLAARGKTVEEADAKALRYHGGLRGGEHGQETQNEELQAVRRHPQRGLEGVGDPAGVARGSDSLDRGKAQVSLRAADGFDPLDRMARNLTGQNSLPPKSPVGNMADDLARNARAAVPEGPATRPTAPLPPGQAAAYDASPEGRATKVQALKEGRGYFQGNPNAAPAGAAPAAPAAPSTTSKLFGSADDWKNFARGPADSPHKTLRMTAPSAPTGLGKGLLALQGAMGAKNAYDGIQEGDTWKAGVGAADAVAGAALFTPAAPVAGAYLGLRGAYDTAKMAGGAIYDNLSEKARDVVGGTVNQIGLNTGLWGVDDSAKMQLDAVAPTTLRKTAPGAPTQTRPEDTFAGPPESARSPVGDRIVFGGGQNDVRRIDRPGQNPLFTNVPDNDPLIGNNNLMNRGQMSAQNRDALDNLAGTQNAESMARVQAAMQAEAQARAQAQAQQASLRAPSSGNDYAWMNDLRDPRNIAARNASMSSSSNLDYNRMSRSEIQARTALAQIEAQKQTAQMNDRTTLRGQDITAETSRYGADASAGASRYSSDNSLRGSMYSSDTQLRGKQMEMQQRLRQQQAVGELWKAANGDPAKFQSLSMQYGLTDAAKTGGEMVQARQTQGRANSEDAQSTFKGMFTRDGKNGPERDENGEAMAHHAASQIVPGWENMSQEQRNAARPRVVEYVNMLQQANKNRDTGWLQKFGLASSNAARSQMPDMGGATLSDVDWWEGAVTPNIGRGDKKVRLRDGTEMHFDSLNEAQRRLLEINGVRPQK